MYLKSEYKRFICFLSLMIILLLLFCKGQWGQETETESVIIRVWTINHTVECQNLNPLSHPNATLAPQARQARASGENLNYVTLVPQARQARSNG